MDEKFVLIEFININNWYIGFLFSHKQGWVFSWHVITIYTSKYHGLPINMILIFIVSYENNFVVIPCRWYGTTFPPYISLKSQ